MPQSMLLLLEIILLVATGYAYWMTRRLVTGSDIPPSLTPGQIRATEGQPDVIEVTREMADLLAELQSMASTVRSDLIRQSAALQEMLNRAETTIAELHTMLDQADVSITPPGHEEEEMSSAAKAMKQDTPLPTLAQALVDFGEYLQGTDRSENTITALVGHVRGFVMWLGGQRFDEIQLKRIGVTEIEGYLDYLNSQNYQANTVKRKLAALRLFTNWIDTLLDAATRPEIDIQQNTSTLALTNDQKNTEETNRVTSVPTAPQADTLAGIDRYRTVIALANQGLDQPAIAARTGLEQEAIRMLLTVGPLSQIGHEFLVYQE